MQISAHIHLHSTNTAQATQAKQAHSDQAQEAMDPQIRSEIARLKARDRDVRAHEQAHVAAGGALVTSGASFSYTTGPDGKRYATGGEVSIDTSSGRTPEETLRKAQQIRRAALAPAQPSGQDRSVAAQATQMEAQARTELQAEKREDRVSQAENYQNSALEAGQFLDIQV